MREALPAIGRHVTSVLLSLSVLALSAAQAVAGQTPAVRLSMAEAVRLALEHNHQLLAQRLNVDISRADVVWTISRPSFLRAAAAGLGALVLAGGVHVLRRRCSICGTRAGTHLFRLRGSAVGYCASCGVSVASGRISPVALSIVRV